MIKGLRICQTRLFLEIRRVSWKVYNLPVNSLLNTTGAAPLLSSRGIITCADLEGVRSTSPPPPLQNKEKRQSLD